MAPPRLLDLPNEVLTLVCRHLCGHCEKCDSTQTCVAQQDTEFYQEEQRQKKQLVDLANLCLASKRMRDIAQPVLHHRLRVDSTDSDSLALFARTIASRPDLAAAVCNIELKEFSTEEYHLSDEDVAMFNAVAERLGLVEKGQSCGGVSVDGIEPEMTWVLALLAHLPKVEELHTVIAATIDDETDGSSLLQLAAKAPLLPPVFSSIRRLSLEHWDTEYGFELEIMAPFMKMMPNLRQLELFACLGATLPKGALSSVRELTVRHSAFIKRDLESLLRACGPLETFSYGCGDATVSQGLEETEFFPRHAVQALLDHGHGKTLRRFEMDLSECEWLDEEPDQDGVCGDMRGLKVLETLRVTSGCLYVETDDDSWTDGGLFVSNLPQSLRCLAITEVHRHVFDDLMALARAAPDKFPHLKRVDIHANWNVSEDLLREEQFVSVLDGFKAAGVTCTKTEWSSLPNCNLT